MEEFYEYLASKGMDMTFCEFSDLVSENGEVITLHIGGRDDSRAKRNC